MPTSFADDSQVDYLRLKKQPRSAVDADVSGDEHGQEFVVDLDALVSDRYVGTKHDVTWDIWKALISDDPYKNLLRCITDRCADTVSRIYVSSSGNVMFPAELTAKLFVFSGASAMFIPLIILSIGIFFFFDLFSCRRRHVNLCKRVVVVLALFLALLSMSLSWTGLWFHEVVYERHGHTVLSSFEVYAPICCCYLIGAIAAFDLRNYCLQSAAKDVIAYEIAEVADISSAAPRRNFRTTLGQRTIVEDDDTLGMVGNATEIMGPQLSLDVAEAAGRSEHLDSSIRFLGAVRQHLEVQADSYGHPCTSSIFAHALELEVVRLQQILPEAGGGFERNSWFLKVLFSGCLLAIWPTCWRLLYEEQKLQEAVFAGGWSCAFRLSYAYTIAWASCLIGWRFLQLLKVSHQIHLKHIVLNFLCAPRLIRKQFVKRYRTYLSGVHVHAVGSDLNCSRRSESLVDLVERNNPEQCDYDDADGDDDYVDPLHVFNRMRRGLRIQLLRGNPPAKGELGEKIMSSFTKKFYCLSGRKYLVCRKILRIMLVLYEDEVEGLVTIFFLVILTLLMLGCALAFFLTKVTLAVGLSAFGVVSLSFSVIKMLNTVLETAFAFHEDALTLLGAWNERLDRIDSSVRRACVDCYVSNETALLNHYFALVKQPIRLAEEHIKFTEFPLRLFGFEATRAFRNRLVMAMLSGSFFIGFSWMRSSSFMQNKVATLAEDLQQKRWS